MDFQFERLGEHALLLRFGEGIDAGVNARVHAACARLRAAPPDGMDELVPAYASVLVRFAADAGAADPLPRWLAQVRDALAADGGTADAAPPRLHRVPVHYGGDDGADLAAVAARLGWSEEEVVRRHVAPEYRVAMLGFAPGFAYLLGMDPALEVPRLERPRTRVPAGAVGIGGAQTGIYPAVLPGGWQLIGRTPWRLFDPRRDQPARLLPGDRVRFEPIAADAFEAIHAREWDA